MINYTPVESARAFHMSPARIKALWGPVGSGKSSAALWEFILMCMESTVPVLGVVIRSSYRELLDTTKMTFEQWFGDISTWHGKNEEFTVELPHPTTRKIQAHTLRFRAIQRPEETQKLQSMEPGFIFLEECVPSFSTTGIMGAGISEEIFKIAAIRLRQKGVPYYRLICTANPPSTTHWFHQKFIASGEEWLAKNNMVSVWQPPFENKSNLPEGYYEELEKVLDADLVRRFVLGESVTLWDGERVFPEARDHFHVIDKEIRPAKNTTLILGFDFGLTPATLITQILPNGQWVWIRELQSFNSGFEQHCDILRAVMKEFYPDHQFRCWGDPNGIAASQTDAKTCYQIGQRFGFEIKAGRQDWQSRKEVIKQRLSRLVGNEPAVLISRQNCPISAEALLGGYRYPKNASGEIGVRPIKNHFSHLSDCAQYIGTREFEIKPGKPYGEQPMIVNRPLLPIDPLRTSAKPVVRGSWLGR